MMNKLSGKKPHKLRNFSLTLLGLVILAFLALNLAKSWKANRQVNQEIVGLQENIKNLEKDNLELKELIEYFNSNAYIEEKARIDLGLKKAGEKVVVVTNQREQGSQIASQVEINKNFEDLSTAEKWWLYFFN